ncbi:Uncharacterised protein [uncultured archaeon]|nr:Uncharacterised protein [uncultured archaeon]
MISYVRQCGKCWHHWDRGTHLTSRGEERKSCPKCGSHYVVDTQLRNTAIIMHEDLLMFTDGQYPQKYCCETTFEELYCDKARTVVHERGVKIFISRGFTRPEHGHYVYLFVDRKLWMCTDPEERASMDRAVKNCSEDARVYIAGLGLGQVLLALARTGKAKEVIVVEREQRVIDIVEPIVRRWMSAHYPAFNWKVVQGDAVKEVGNHGKFDWIFFDIWSDGDASNKDEPNPQEVKSRAEKSVTVNGKVDIWTMIIQDMKDDRRGGPEARAKLEAAMKNLMTKDGLINLKT